jgi:hypothetical protein
MAQTKKSNPDNNPFNECLSKWKDLQPASPQRDGHRAMCWLVGFGLLLHPAFAYLPAKWPLFVMDGFLILVVLIIVWHERNATKS